MLLARLLAWAPPGQPVTVFDRACRPAVVTRGDDELYGTLTREIRRSKTTLTESFDELSIGATLSELGCSSAEYEREASGRWVLTSSQGLGCARLIGNALSEVTDDAAWYDGAYFRLTIGCLESVRETTACPDGTTRACLQCERWGVKPQSLESRYGIHRQTRIRDVTATTTSACGSPCPADDPPADVRRANEALRGGEFFRTLDVTLHPVVFRTAAACRAYRKVHRFSAEELDAWTAGKPRPPDLPPLADEEAAESP